MYSFTNFIIENTEGRKDPKSKTLHAFDIDETLFAHDPSKVRIHVRDKKTGQRVKSLTNQEYNVHKLHPDHEYDYSEFKSSDVFRKSAHPIRSMIAKLKGIHRHNKNVELVTARSDMDDPKAFGQHLKKYGIDIGNVHVRRSGNLKIGSAAENKAAMISSLIKKHGYNRVHLYDDSMDNLEHFQKLKQQHPDVKFHAHHVHHDPETGQTKLTTFEPV